MQYTWQLALRASTLVLVPVYFIKCSVSCYIYYIRSFYDTELIFVCISGHS